MAESTLNLVEELLAQNRIQNAYRIIEEYITTYQNNAEAFVYRANANFYLYKIDAAFVDAKKAIELEPNNTKALNNIANFYFYINEPDNAILYLLKSYTSDNENGTTIELLVIIIA